MSIPSGIELFRTEGRWREPMFTWECIVCDARGGESPSIQLAMYRGLLHLGAAHWPETWRTVAGSIEQWAWDYSNEQTKRGDLCLMNDR